MDKFLMNFTGEVYIAKTVYLNFEEEIIWSKGDIYYFGYGRRELEEEKLFGIFTNQINIVKRNGTEYRFFLEKRNKVVEFLQTR